MVVIILTGQKAAHPLIEIINKPLINKYLGIKQELLVDNVAEIPSFFFCGTAYFADALAGMKT